MTSERIKTGREEKIVSLYQLDPGFYKKILSRNPSLKCSSSISVYRNPGGVPFTWEMQPGKPREESKTEIARPIRLPPAVHGLNMPKATVSSLRASGLLVEARRESEEDQEHAA
ncbi:hypothetical protein OIU77_005929 [Salix suchowensis]|uniref:Uncharacterized protein n=1 Tax=Salix suchowensis TaxID=1278906 RepID=A0ABQ9ASQ5_9ROSI|nr:hypothetical protein OIU77_005929 [Salix suchowensis]